MNPGTVPESRPATGTSLIKASLSTDVEFSPIDPEIASNDFQNYTDIKELIPNINTEGLIFAGNNSPLIQNVGLNRQTCFADILCERISFQKEDWPSMIKGQVVVDLCAGCRPHGYYLACIGEAKAYIGVDAHVADSLFFTLNRREALITGLRKYTDEYTAETGKTVSLIPKIVVAEDAATFLERITDNSVSLFTIGMHSLLENHQLERLDKSMSLALSNTGCIVAYPEYVCGDSKLKVSYQRPIYIGRMRD